MSWTKIDDGILTHPKMADAEEACPVYAWVLWSKALVYVNQHKLDGRVTRKIATRIVGANHVDAAVDALVSTGLWDVAVDGWTFHDFDAHNDTKERRGEKAKKNADAQAAYREKCRLDREAAKQKVSDYASGSNDPRNEPVSDYENSRNPPPVPSSPVPSSPVLSPPLPSGGDETASGGGDPTEAEMFLAYTVAVNNAAALALTHVRSGDNAHALSSVRGMYGFHLAKAEYLAQLADWAGQYVADAAARGQEMRFEKNFAPTKFLAWMQARKGNVDPFPRAPVRLLAQGWGGSQGSPAQSPPRPDLKLVQDEPEIVPAPLDDPARLACLRALSGMSGAG